MYRILIPLDGSSRSERSIVVVDCLAEALGAEVELLRVVDPKDIPTTSTAVLAPEVVDSYARMADEYLRDATRRFHRVQPIATHLLQGRASEEIVRVAREGSFDLVVTTTHGYTGLGGAILGSVAREVVRDSAIPVLLLPERVALPLEPRAKTVLVPLDGSPLAESVLEPLLRLATVLDWRFVLFWVADRTEADRPTTAGDMGARAAAETPSNVPAHLARVAGRVCDCGLQADVRVGFTDCGPAIVRLAEEDEIDLIAMSTHGRSGLRRLVLGSVTEYVISHANKPVLVVRPQRTDQGEGENGA